MLHPELQKILDYALQQGGELSANQIELLNKKARELGEDTDILAMVIDVEIQKIKKQILQEKQTNFSCPNCGSSIPKSSIKCSFCNFEISRNTATGEDYINKLSAALANIDQEYYSRETKLTASQLFNGAGDATGSKMIQAKVSVISTFTMPNDKENLLEFFYFCDTNADSCYASSKVLIIHEKNNYKTLGNSWAGKAKLAYDKLKRFVNEDEEIKILVDNYKNKYYVDPSQNRSNSFANNATNEKAVLFGLNKNGVILGALLLVMCFPLCWLPFVMPQFKGE
jgi:hypothetical protein